jgi:hypothetical protein
MEVNPDDSLTGAAPQYKKMTGTPRAPVMVISSI